MASAPPALAVVDTGTGTVVASAALEPYAGRVGLVTDPTATTVSVANGDLGTLSTVEPR